MFQSIRRRLASYAGIVPITLLTFFYSAGSFHSEYVHQLIHTDEYAALHSEEAENDPCHISIYHAGRDHGCEHKYHFTTDASCALDHLFCNPIHLITTAESLIQSDLQMDYTSPVHQAATEKLVYLHGSRAPPLC